MLLQALVLRSILLPLCLLITFGRHQTGFLRNWLSAFHLYIANLPNPLCSIKGSLRLLFRSHHHHQMNLLHKVCVIHKAEKTHHSIHGWTTLSMLKIQRSQVDLTPQWLRFMGFVEMIGIWKVLNICYKILGELLNPCFLTIFMHYTIFTSIPTQVSLCFWFNHVWSYFWKLVKVLLPYYLHDTYMRCIMQKLLFDN